MSNILNEIAFQGGGTFYDKSFWHPKKQINATTAKQRSKHKNVCQKESNPESLAPQSDTLPV